MFEWSNPKLVNLKEPYLYFIRIVSKSHEYRYVGKASKKSRLNEYRRNVEKILLGKTRRPKVKKDGTPQSKGNLRYRYVHLVLAIAETEGWLIEHYPLENVNKETLNIREQALIKTFNCNMNDHGTWAIEQYQDLYKTFKREELS